MLVSIISEMFNAQLSYWCGSCFHKHLSQRIVSVKRIQMSQANHMVFNNGFFDHEFSNTYLILIIILFNRQKYCPVNQCFSNCVPVKHWLLGTQFEVHQLDKLWLSPWKFACSHLTTTYNFLQPKSTQEYWSNLRLNRVVWVTVKSNYVAKLKS